MSIPSHVISLAEQNEGILFFLVYYDIIDNFTGQIQKALDLYNNNGVKCYCFTMNIPAINNNTYTYTTYDVLTILKIPFSQYTLLSQRLQVLWQYNSLRDPFTKLNTAIEIAYKNRSNNFCFTMPHIYVEPPTIQPRSNICGNDLILLNKYYRNKPEVSRSRKR